MEGSEWAQAAELTTTALRQESNSLGAMDGEEEADMRAIEEARSLEV